MNRNRPIVNLEFKAGDDVVLAGGPYQGTPGVFLHLTNDVSWAEIEERNSQGFRRAVRSHPLVWLRRAGDDFHRD